MSSRLFQELREERGLAYSVCAWHQAFADTGIVAVSCAADRNRAVESMQPRARRCSPRRVESLDEAELERARAQVEAGLLMALETPQGRADHMARSIEVFGRIVDARRAARASSARYDATTARAAGARLLDGRGRGRLGRRAARAGGVSDLQTLIAEPWADWGLIDCGNGQKLERYGPVTRRPARAAGDVGAGARRLGPRRDLRPRFGRGRRRALGPAPAGARAMGAGARRTCASTRR